MIPLLEFSPCLAKQGFEITIMNTEHSQKHGMDALAETNHIGDANIHLVSITDDMEPGANRNDLGKLHDTMSDTMSMKLEELINTIHRLGVEEITSVIADESLGWALEVAVTTRIRRVGFSPASAAMLAKLFSIPKPIQEKLIDFDGQLKMEGSHLASTDRILVHLSCPSDRKLKLLSNRLLSNY